MPVRKKTSKRAVTSRRVPDRMVLPKSKSKPGSRMSDYITMFFGQPGIGKTTFVNNLGDDVLFLSTDRGTRFMSAMRVECLDWKDFLKAIELIEKSPGQYKYVAIDHVGDWADLAEMYVCEKLGIESLADADWGKGWSAYRKELHTFIARLKAIRTGVVFIAHEATRNIEIAGMKVDRCQPDMGKSAWKAIIPLCDLIGYCSMKPMKDPKSKKRVEVRVLETEPRRDLFVKDRTDRKRPSGGRSWEMLDGQRFISTFQAARS